jgi:hypothetical protein
VPELDRPLVSSRPITSPETFWGTDPLPDRIGTPDQVGAHGLADDAGSEHRGGVT